MDSKFDDDSFAVGLAGGTKLKISCRVHMGDHHEDISCGNARQTFRWLSKAIEGRLPLLKSVRNNYGAEKVRVTAFKNKDGELINPFDMIIEHGPVGADMVEVWADSETCSEMDKNGDPVYPEWYAAGKNEIPHTPLQLHINTAFVMSEEGRIWQNKMGLWREKERLDKQHSGATTATIQIGTVFFTEAEGSNAFNSDWGLFEFNNLIVSKHIVSDACLEKIRPIYTSLCNIMQHFAGPGQIGKTFGITPAEFGRIIHYINLVNYKEERLLVDQCFLDIINESARPEDDSIVPLMARHQLVKGLLTLLFKFNKYDTDTSPGIISEAIENMCESINTTWLKMQDSYIICGRDSLIMRVLHDYRLLIKPTFDRMSDDGELSLEVYCKLVQHASITALDCDKDCVSSFMDSQLDPSEERELQSIVFIEFVEAVARFALAVVNEDKLSDVEKIRIAFDLLI